MFCTNVVKRVQRHATSKKLAEKFDHFQTWANNTQRVTTSCNRVAKCVQHIVPNNIAICCVEILRSFGRGFANCINKFLQNISYKKARSVTVCFWETAHQPLSKLNINTYFSLWAKCQVLGGVGGQFTRNTHWSKKPSSLRKGGAVA